MKTAPFPFVYVPQSENLPAGFDFSGWETLDALFVPPVASRGPKNRPFAYGTKAREFSPPHRSMVQWELNGATNTNPIFSTYDEGPEGAVLCGSYVRSPTSMALIKIGDGVRLDFNYHQVICDIARKNLELARPFMSSQQHAAFENVVNEFKLGKLQELLYQSAGEALLLSERT